MNHLTQLFTCVWIINWLSFLWNQITAKTATPIYLVGVAVSPLFSIRVGNHFGLQNYNDQTIEVKKKKENKDINLLTAKLIRQKKKNYVSALKQIIKSNSW